MTPSSLARSPRHPRHQSGRLTLLAGILAGLILNPAQGSTYADPLPAHASFTTRMSDDRMVELPLQSTHVSAEVSAFVARVNVVQTYVNPFTTPIEATYLFPLPDRAAVDDFLLEVGDRRIHGEIHRREDAARIYETARSAGLTAAVMHQERPNIFSQAVANIAPGHLVRVHLSYVDILPYQEGGYRFLFPMVVGPRFFPGSVSSPELQPASSTINDDAGAILIPPTQPTDVVPDANRINPPVLRPGTRSGHDISLVVSLDAGVPIHGIRSPSHRISMVRSGSSNARVALASDDSIPNRDFMLQWDVAGESPEVGLLAHRKDDDGFFTLLVQPKARVDAEEAAPKEIIFVLDESGSMSGLPIEMSRRFMRLALQSMGRRDRFNIVSFSNSARTLSPVPLDNTERNKRTGLDAVATMEGSGGTMMLEGFKAAMNQPHDPSRVRILFFLTDGHIGNEGQILEMVRQSRGEARVFTLGVGSSVNHYLLREMAEAGRGVYTHIRPDGNEVEAVKNLHEWVTRPYLTDLEIDWGTLSVEDVRPTRIPDLYSGQSLSLVGRYLWEGVETVILRGRLGGVPWEKEIRVSLPERSLDHGALASAWARTRIRDLTIEPGALSKSTIEAQVTSLALAYRLMSPFTSFVAVDESQVVNPGGDPIRVDQALNMPEFVSFEGCFGPAGPGHLNQRLLPEPAARSSGAFPHPAGTGSLAGRILDTTGSGVSGVTVTISRTSRPDLQSQVRSDLRGDYEFPRLPGGSDYVIHVSAVGFAPMEVGPLDIPPGGTTRQDLTLRADADTTETIVVESPGHIVDTGSTTTRFSQEFIDSLPVIGGNYQDILALAAGATDSDGNGSVHGAPSTGLGLRVDGGGVSDPASGTLGGTLNSDIAGELEVITSGASAAFGRADGGFAGVVGGTGSVVRAPRHFPIIQDRELEKLALRVLADLADDRRLTRSEGLPSLAGLLAAQYADGGFSKEIRTQALVCWALSEATEASPALPWVRDAALKGAAFLRRIDIQDATWRSLVGGRVDWNATAWIVFSLAVVDGCVARPDSQGEALNHAQRLLSQFRTSPDDAIGRVIDRILRRSPGDPVCTGATGPVIP